MTLREFRERRGLTLQAIGLLADISPATASRLERGLHEPQPTTLVKLARALGFSVKRLRAILDESAIEAQQTQGSGIDAA